MICISQRKILIINNTLPASGLQIDSMKTILIKDNRRNKGSLEISVDIEWKQCNPPLEVPR